MKVIEHDQLSPEWFEARRGIPTASQFDRIITAKTMKLAAASEDYINELVAEVFHQGPLSDASRPMSPAMLHGVQTEGEARAFYEMENAEVTRVGLCLTDDGRFGASPDGLVGDDGALELKCPTGKVHVGYLREGVLPAEYRAQVHGELIVTGRAWVDFMSYCIGLPPLVIRVVPDEFTVALRSALDVFHGRLMEAIEKIRAL